jgi:hypothetical protein
MRDEDRQLLNSKITELLHRALVTIRNATYPQVPGDEDRRAEINDLADLVHNFPYYLAGVDQLAIDSPSQLRAAVVEHVKRFYPMIEPDEHHWVRILDMDSETFQHEHKYYRWAELASS